MSDEHTAGDQTVPCTICTKLTPILGIKLCEGCWELKIRLEGYLPSLLANPEAARNARRVPPASTAIKSSSCPDAPSTHESWPYCSSLGWSTTAPAPSPNSTQVLRSFQLM